MSGSGVAGEKAPTALVLAVAVAAQIASFLCGSKRGGFVRINADVDDGEIFTGVETQILQGFDQAVKSKRAEKRTRIVPEHEDDGFLVEAGGELGLGAVFIAEGKRKGDLLI